MKTVGVRTKLIATAAMGAAISCPAFAQESESREADGTSQPGVIIVTASKRETILQDTPMSITALDSDMIEKRGLAQMSDYLSTVPGVTMQDSGVGDNSIVIRGVAVQPDVEREAVSVYFGEAPVSGVLARDGGGGHADFKMVDIERVEVLRGPQGTLYGAGSMGGTVRIIPAAPNLGQVEGKVGVQYSHTGELGGANTMMQGVVNLPLLEDRLALRAVAYRYDDSGYVENVAASYTGSGNVIDTVNLWGGSARDASDIGAVRTTGGRVSALWRPFDPLSISATYVRQEAVQTGLPGVETYLPGKFQQVRTTPGAALPLALNGDELGSGEGVEVDTELATIELDYDLGWGNLHSASSWLSQESRQAQDYTRALPVYGILWNFVPQSHDFFTQEVRFVSAFDGPFQVLAGFYYENKDQKQYFTQGSAGDPARTGDLIIGLDWPVPANAPPGFTFDGWEEFSYRADWTKSLKQTAFFGEVNWNITERLEAAFGARHFSYDQSAFVVGDGLINGVLTTPSTTPIVLRDVAGKNQGETYKANLNWKPVDDVLLYFQWAQGFRPGEALVLWPQSAYDPANTGSYTLSVLLGDGSSIPGDQIPIRAQTDPDTLENFELGFKGVFADNRVTVNAAIYRINWTGLPVSVPLYNFDAGAGLNGTIVNVGKAVIEGAELEASWRVSDDLQFDLSASYNDAELGRDQPGLGSKGDDLPGSANFNLSASLEYGFRVAGHDAFARVDYAYLSEFEAELNQPDAVPMSGGYGQLHLKAGVELGPVNLDVFVKNLTNADSITWARSFPFGTAFRLRPRTVGLNFDYMF